MCREGILVQENICRSRRDQGTQVHVLHGSSVQPVAAMPLVRLRAERGQCGDGAADNPCERAVDLHGKQYTKQKPWQAALRETRCENLATKLTVIG